MQYDKLWTQTEVEAMTAFSKQLRPISLSLAAWAHFEFLDGCDLPQIKERLKAAATVAERERVS